MTGVDFVAVPSTDWKRSRAFYVDTLGLRPDETGDAEFWVGETCFGIYEPTTFGLEFAPQKTAHLALHVEDMPAARAELEAKGIEFAGETFDTGVCYMAFFEDPDGNALMLHHRYAPRDDGGQRLVIGVERTDFIGVPVTDRERAVEFYGETLGLKRNPLAHEEWPEFETGNVTILLNTPEQTGVPFSPSNTAIALRVPDVAEAMAKLEEAGVTFLFPEAYDSASATWRSSRIRTATR